MMILHMGLFTRSKKSSRSGPPNAPAPAAQRNGEVSPSAVRDAGSAAPQAPADPALEASIQSIGRDLLDAARRNKSGFLSAAFWSDKLMDWSMKDEAFKVQLFRFVDTFPMLKTSAQIHEHLIDYITQPGVTPPPALAVGIKAGGWPKDCSPRRCLGRSRRWRRSSLPAPTRPAPCRS